MDAGAKASWRGAFAWADENPTEISAIQHAYNTAIDLGLSVLFDDAPEVHRRFANGVRGEKPVEVSAGGRTINEWIAIPNQEDHPLDCLVGAMVAASAVRVAQATTPPIAGAASPPAQQISPAVKPRRRRRYRMH